MVCTISTSPVAAKTSTKIRVEREQLEIEQALLADLATFCERRIYLDTVAHERLLLAVHCRSCLPRERVKSSADVCKVECKWVVKSR
jgi:hypothetical protein